MALHNPAHYAQHDAACGAEAGERDERVEGFGTVVDSEELENGERRRGMGMGPPGKMLGGGHNGQWGCWGAEGAGQKGGGRA